MAAGPQTSAPPTRERTMLVRIFLPITLLLKMPPRILPLWTRSRRRPTVAPESDWKWEKYDDSRSPGMRQEGFSEKQILESARRAKLAKWFFMQGWFGILGALKWATLRVVHSGRSSARCR